MSKQILYAYCMYMYTFYTYKCVHRIVITSVSGDTLCIHIYVCSHTTHSHTSLLGYKYIHIFDIIYIYMYICTHTYWHAYCAWLWINMNKGGKRNHTLKFGELRDMNLDHKIFAYIWCPYVGQCVELLMLILEFSRQFWTPPYERKHHVPLRITFLLGGHHVVIHYI